MTSSVRARGRHHPIAIAPQRDVPAGRSSIESATNGRTSVHPGPGNPRAAAVLFSLAPSTPAAASSTTEAAQIIRIARAQVGDRYRYGTAGPSTFDCSGLVLYSYRRAGDANVLRYAGRSARSLYYYFKARGKASRSNPRIGDIVVWGAGTHVGIYIGNGRAVSAIRSGVRVHGVFAVTARFTAYLHTGMSSRYTSASAPTS